MSDRGQVATDVVRRLRTAGHETYLAGGCVRDRLLGREPGDWDIATAAPPEAVRALFRRTVAVGARFGVRAVDDEARLRAMGRGRAACISAPPARTRQA
jgi:tRNA nucleotidyltransferase/poly(A) polymerase